MSNPPLHATLASFAPLGGITLGVNRGHLMKRTNMGSGLAMTYPWPNNPVELTAHSVRFFGYFLHFLLWAAAHRER